MSDFVASGDNSRNLAPWRSPLARALHRNRSRPYSRYFQLATVQSNGRPANRTVVFRGFWAEGNGLLFVTDQRSQKVNDLSHCSWAEACWYFTQTREQFRLAGAVTLICHNQPDPALQQARQQSWESLSEPGRQSFYWPVPGQPRHSGEDFYPAPGSPAPTPPPTFCLGWLMPDTVDHLELRGDPQNRTRYEVIEGQWQAIAVNP
ncbi:MAG: pyridoxamine 5'-phosphate oxidase [Leptolyngbyaceae cyanobacterium SM2_5_2]|nr:pyridoxamine 5'-phosphate oxidase [Leptolyngbyaceae cyanobacterium SM2_5_2]